MSRQCYIGFARGTSLEATIITRPGNAGELEEMSNVNFAAVRCSHDFDDFRETGAIAFPIRRVQGAQGFVKKIDIERLLSDLAFKFGNSRAPWPVRRCCLLPPFGQG